jgi:hypothetical protein
MNEIKNPRLAANRGFWNALKIENTAISSGELWLLAA